MRRTGYSLNETASDYAMKHFSIARDQRCLIPYIKSALAFAPGSQAVRFALEPADVDEIAPACIITGL